VATSADEELLRRKRLAIIEVEDDESRVVMHFSSNTEEAVLQNDAKEEGEFGGAHMPGAYRSGRFTSPETDEDAINEIMDYEQQHVDHSEHPDTTAAAPSIGNGGAYAAEIVAEAVQTPILVIGSVAPDVDFEVLRALQDEREQQKKKQRRLMIRSGSMLLFLMAVAAVIVCVVIWSVNDSPSPSDTSNGELRIAIRSDVCFSFQLLSIFLNVFC
jgi:hypothetical protein